MAFAPASMLAASQHFLAGAETRRHPALRATQLGVLGSSTRAVARSAFRTGSAVVSPVTFLLAFVQSAIELLSAKLLAFPLSSCAFRLALRSSAVALPYALLLAGGTFVPMAFFRTFVQAARQRLSAHSGARPFFLGATSRDLRGATEARSLDGLRTRRTWSWMT